MAADFSFTGLMARGAISLAEVVRLRREVLPNGVREECEAAGLLELEAAFRVKDLAWTSLVIEGVSDWLVNHEEPQGYLTVAKAAWLKPRLALRGGIVTSTGLEIIIAALGKARWAPASLSAFALEQVRRTIADGAGQSAPGEPRLPGVVEPADTLLLRRILVAFGSGQPVAVTRAEADVLMAIAEGSHRARSTPLWEELFTAALANFLMATSGYAVPARHVMLEAHASLDLGAGPGDALATASAFKAALRHCRRQSQEEAERNRLEQEKVALITAERVEHDEAHWLAARLGRTPALVEAGAALMAALSREGAELHPALLPLIGRAA
jgi:hypothetical protein